jgi:DNA-binding PadR family transcriptional regulator
VRHEFSRANDAWVLVLASLADGPKHGYAITHDVHATTGVQLRPGTLYGLIPRLEHRGYIEAMAQHERRRPYRLTAAGANALKNEAIGMRTVAELSLTRLSTRATLA